MLKFLYHTAPGRMLLKLLANRKLSILAGRWLDSPSSKFLINPFLDKNNINRANYLDEEYTCFNDCFTRRIRPELRPIDERKNSLIAPSDGLLRAYPIKDGVVMPIKESQYSIETLLRDPELAAEYEGGTALVFRLCVTHYHRYCFPDNGKILKNYFIDGVLHTVQPVALSALPVFTENCREITVLETENFGRLTQIEVGAMLVGKIKNHAVTEFNKGQEKGMFLYGGSTIVLLVKKDTVTFPSVLFEASAEGRELSVKQGQRIAILK